jgi:hypothetical protein
MSIPAAKPPNITLASPRGLPSIPHVGCIAGQGVSYTGEQYGDVPDVRAIGLIKAVQKCLNEVIATLTEGEADNVLTSAYSTHSSRLTGEVGDMAGEMTSLISAVTSETNAIVSFVNGKIATVNAAKAALTGIPSGQRSKVQQLMIDRYTRYASELSAQAGHLASILSCLGA